MKTYSVNQSHLTSECWSIQFHGLECCKTCEFRDTDDCGGKNIRKTGKNAFGYMVPISEENQK